MIGVVNGTCRLIRVGESAWLLDVNVKVSYILGRTEFDFFFFFCPPFYFLSDLNLLLLASFSPP